MLDQKTLASITKKVEHQFPEVAGSKPNVRVQNPPQAKNASPTSEPTRPTYLVTYRGSVDSPSGGSILRLVRVVVNADGKILKMTTSR